ncbi:MAG: hypothetical protein HS126_20125 [Anaerolineales bacterium]|nr:hypothetical protein [Anaerolineales bacterium]
MTYNLNKIRALLTEGFSAEELRRFCHDEPDFRSVYDQLAANTGKAEIVDRLLECATQKVLIKKLLAWAKDGNPGRYKVHRPYYYKTLTVVSNKTGSAIPQKAHSGKVKTDLLSSTHKVDHSSITTPIDSSVLLNPKVTLQ